MAAVGPLVIVGDFNLIMRMEDKNNSNVNRGLMTAFRRFLSEVQLKDMYLHGRRYTWSNEQQNATMVKLDRVLYNEQWNTAFPNCLLQGLSTSALDHCPLILVTNNSFKPCRQFRFENMWTKWDGFQDTVQSAWTSVNYTEDEFLSLNKKLTATAKALKAWSSRRCSDLKLCSAIVSELVLRLDIAMDNR